MSTALEAYAALMISDNLGLAKGALEGPDVPTELVGMIRDAMGGSESAARPAPELEAAIASFGKEFERAAIDKDGFLITKARWPDRAPYAACLTHDVDNISRPSGHLLRTRNRFSARDTLFGLLHLRSPYQNLKLVSSAEATAGYRSTFYFLTGNYRLSDVAEDARRLQARGWEIGLHGDFGTHDSLQRMTEAKSALEREVGVRADGVREHFLKFEYGKTWEVASQAGFAYDSTVGNRDTLGFRLGLSSPFFPPDHEWRPLPLLELPLTLMDTTLWGYLKRTEGDGLADFKTLKERVKSVGGLFTLLWHQEAFRMRGGRIYPRLLDEFRKDGCFVGSGAKVAEWWKARHKPLAREGSSFRFEGAPAGLCLVLKAKDPQKVSVTGGTLSHHETESIIELQGGDCRVVVG